MFDGSVGLHTVPEGHLATVVTSLEMASRPHNKTSAPSPKGVSLRQMQRVSVEEYRDVYRRVGADWLWFSRLKMSDAELAAIIDDPHVELSFVTKDGENLGLLELDFREPGSCELSFFGLAAELIGKGAGRWLMTQAITKAWAQPISRFWVHTCTFDHPEALNFYVRSGFVPFRRQVEIVADPRLDGTLPRTAAPQVPLLHN